MWLDGHFQTLDIWRNGLKPSHFFVFANKCCIMKWHTEVQVKLQCQLLSIYSSDASFPPEMFLKGVTTAEALHLSLSKHSPSLSFHFPSSLSYTVLTLDFTQIYFFHKVLTLHCLNMSSHFIDFKVMSTFSLGCFVLTTPTLKCM